jgi:hypothetical protein
MFSKDPAGSVPCQREGHRPLCGRRPTNDKAAKRRPVINPGICHEENLERAKGLEPSTPTLARSCSTTELHPHPRWRRTLAVNGRPMPNADCECNSPLTVWRHPENSISPINGRESVRNSGQTRFPGFRRLISGTWGLHPPFEEAIRACSRTRGPNRRGQFAAAANLRLRPPFAQRRSPVAEAAPGGLNFAAKPPSSERELGAGPC